LKHIVDGWVWLACSQWGLFPYRPLVADFAVEVLGLKEVFRADL
jgi:hypothetical protein